MGLECSFRVKQIGFVEDFVLVADFWGQAADFSSEWGGNRTERKRYLAACLQTLQALWQFVAVSVAEGEHNRGDGGSVVGGAVGW